VFGIVRAEDGTTVTGWPIHIVIRGHVVVREERLTGTPTRLRNPALTSESLPGDQRCAERHDAWSQSSRIPTLARYLVKPIVIQRIIALESPTPKPRPVALGQRTIHLTGAPPAFGSALVADFEIPAARGSAPLRRETLSGALCFVSTLPNIQKNACVAQIVHLHRHCRTEFPEVAVHHVSADPLEHWRELDTYHADVRAHGYSLAEASPLHARAFERAFGVGVIESHRVAHGLFALSHGRFLASEIPSDQLETADVDRFLATLRVALAVSASSQAAAAEREKQRAKQ
jgi:hypothetical protein